RAAPPAAARADVSIGKDPVGDFRARSREAGGGRAARPGVTAKQATEKRGQRGIVLVVVLWVLALLGIVAASFQRDTRVETPVTPNLVENAKAEALADAGVQRAILGLLDPDDTKAWLADGTPYQFSLGEGQVRVTLQDEAGKIDLNQAPDNVLLA